jgi:hypothetical protein
MDHEPDFIVVGEKVALGPLRRDLAATDAGRPTDVVLMDAVPEDFGESVLG